MMNNLQNYNLPGFLLILISMMSCSDSQLSLEQYSTRPVKFDKEKFTIAENEFSMLFQKGWTWKKEDHEDENILWAINGASSPDKDGFIDIVSILKLKSDVGSKTVESEFLYLKSELENETNNRKILDTGRTQLFRNDAYFFHTEYETGTYGEPELITFILAAKETGVFYHITASASQTHNLNNNMAVMIQSLVTFNPKEYN